MIPFGKEKLKTVASMIEVSFMITIILMTSLARSLMTIRQRIKVKKK